MPGYEPFLLCDFHVHTQWSDGRLSLRDVIDLYGRTRRFDVIAITDHILMERDLFARAGRLMSLGRRAFSVTADRFDQYLEDIDREARRAKKLYDLLVIPGAEVTQNHIRSRKNAHIVALNIREYISADQSAEEILREIRRQGALSVACHPHHRTTRRIEISTCYLWDNRKKLVDLVDVWEAANRDDLFSVTSLKHYPYVANSDFHKSKHLYSWKTLLSCEKNWEAVARALRSNVDVALDVVSRTARGPPRDECDQGSVRNDRRRAADAADLRSARFLPNAERARQASIQPWRFSSEISRVKRSSVRSTRCQSENCCSRMS